MVTPDIWASASHDEGATWEVPRRIARNCWSVLDLATSVDGYIVVLANCFTYASNGDRSQATLVMRRPGGDWLPPQALEVGAAFGSVAIIGTGAAARAVALVTTTQAPNTTRITLLAKRLADDSAWTIQTRSLLLPHDEALDDPAGGTAWHVRGLVFPRPRPDGSVQTGVTFTWATDTRAALFALTSLDGGQTWGQVETILYRPGNPKRVGFYPFVTPAYDPVADRLLAIWTCCGAAEWEPLPATHYASWSVPGSGAWHALPAPFVVGSISSPDTASAQALNSRTAWLAWIEGGQQVEVRSLELNTIIPADQYPAATPEPSPGPNGGA